MKSGEEWETIGGTNERAGEGHKVERVGMCSQKDNEEQGTRRSPQWQFQRPFAGGHCDWTA